MDLFVVTYTRVVNRAELNFRIPLLEAIEQSKPVVLLSDLGMPNINEHTLMHQIRSMPPTKGGCIRAIALTAYATSADQQQALVAGFQLHIAKPVELASLVAAIAHLTQHSY